jgi:hypothetical protein
MHASDNGVSPELINVLVEWLRALRNPDKSRGEEPERGFDYLLATSAFRESKETALFLRFRRNNIPSGTFYSNLNWRMTDVSDVTTLAKNFLASKRVLELEAV